MNIKKIHRLTGTILSVFIVLHLANHLFALGNPAAHELVQKYLRLVYRNPVIEVFLLLAVFIQIVAGIILIFKKKFRSAPLMDKLQVLSGLYLSFFMIYHVRAVLMGRFVWNVETDYHFAAYGVKNYPLTLFFVPYYFLAVLTVFVHIAAIHRSKVSERRGLKVGVRQSRYILISGFITATLILMALAGVHLINVQ